MAPPARVLVIGAGFAGVPLAIRLVSNPALDVTLLDRKEYFDIIYANARVLVEPALSDKTVVPIKDLKPHGRFVRGEVAELHPRKALLADGRSLEFDYAAVCTGSSQPWGKAGHGAVTVEERRAELKADHAALVAAPAVVVVGGGSLGVELAAEVATEFPGKPCYLVHSGDRLMHQSLPPRASSLALSWLQGHGVTVLTGQRLAGNGDGGGGGGAPLRTTGGAELPAGSRVLWATGTRPTAGFLKPALAAALDPATGLVRVGPTLQVEGHPQLFALGDACSVAEEKLAYLAKSHAPLVAANIAALAAAGVHLSGGGADGVADGEAAAVGPKSKLKSWKPGMGIPTVMIVSLGRNSGLAHLGYVTFSGRVTTWMKSIDKFVAISRKEVCAVP